jgi:ankyrin repeat protein
MSESDLDVRDFVRVIDSGDPIALRALFDSRPELLRAIDEPHFAFASPAIVASRRNLPLVDVLLEHGADINARSQWWAGGFHILDNVALSDEDEHLAEALIARGARVGPHAAAALGRIDRLRELIEADPSLIHARGGDGQTPLHFARTVETVDLLLDHGADIDARDVDHSSTPAQHRVADRPAVARRLIERGAAHDILLAAALGDLDRVKDHVAASPSALRIRVDEEHFPRLDAKAGGHIYIWTLGSYASAHQVARRFGHSQVYDWLMAASPPEIRLVENCWEGNAEAVERLLANEPGLFERTTPAERKLVTHAARNDLAAAVELYFRAGFPADATGQHGATALHWAAFHGNAGLVRRLLEFSPPLETKDRDFSLSPLGWAAYGSRHGWRCEQGDYESTVVALLDAGALLSASFLGTSTEAVAARLRAALDRAPN